MLPGLRRLAGTRNLSHPVPIFGRSHSARSLETRARQSPRLPRTEPPQGRTVTGLLSSGRADTYETTVPDRIMEIPGSDASMRHVRSGACLPVVGRAAEAMA